VFWFQALAAFAVWIGVGVWLSRRSSTLRCKLSALPAGRRTLVSAGALLFSIAILGGGFAIAVVTGQWTEAGFTPLGWIVVAVAGAIFVALQTLGASILVLGAMAARVQETERQRDTSS